MDTMDTNDVRRRDFLSRFNDLSEYGVLMKLIEYVAPTSLACSFL